MLKFLDPRRTRNGNFTHNTLLNVENIVLKSFFKINVITLNFFYSLCIKKLRLVKFLIPNPKHS